MRRNRGGFYNIYRQPVSSPGQERRVAEAPFHQYPTDWSRDGHTIIFTNLDTKTRADVWAMPATGEAPIAILNSRFNEYAARLSPDGKWLAYTSDESGRAEVYLQRFPAGDKHQVTTQGGMHPAWRADGRELFYLGADRKVYVVPTTAGVLGNATKVFDVSVDTSLGSMHANHVAVSADGQSFWSTSRPSTKQLWRPW